MVQPSKNPGGARAGPCGSKCLVCWEDTGYNRPQTTLSLPGKPMSRPCRVVLGAVLSERTRGYGHNDLQPCPPNYPNSRGWIWAADHRKSAEAELKPEC